MEIPEEILYNRNKGFQKARGGGGMKVLVIPDVHLKPFMFQQAAALMRQGIAERAVCLMDIPDDWNKEYDCQLYFLNPIQYLHGLKIIIAHLF